MPPSFFKYRAWTPTLKRQPDGGGAATNYTEQLLTNHSLFCQNPRAFDDPHDGHTGAVPTGGPHDLDRFVLENMIPVVLASKKHGFSSMTQLVTSDSPEARAARRSLAGQTFRRSLFVCSLSAVGDHDLMWTFYADQHRGICLDFDGRHPCFAAAKEVKYGAVPPRESDDFEDRLLHKSSAWEFQREWRVLSDSRTFGFPPEALKRIILGYRFPEQHFEPLVAILTRGGYRVVIDKMQRRPNSYELLPTTRGEISSRS
ncbi:DUF2971 domain-containing protein [Oleiharenicola sp. Vm1]|uniref:DUF2971 domain-containing protein n=1 Tax=Oleiharenicola sp. Vm1 TaxID=3398393 RepID=UPI0039F4F54C